VANHSSLAIANEFLRRHGAETLPSHLQLQKLVYMAHGWNLAINGEPLVAEPVQAWDNGPVFRKIWDHIRDFGFGGKTRLLENPQTKKPFIAHLTPDETAVIDHVWKKYGVFSGLELSRMTHEPETPWSKTYFCNGKNASISNEIIKNHYVDLAMKGRSKQAVA
jgi:uncharacterized phage-associated protein